MCPRQGELITVSPAKPCTFSSGLLLCRGGRLALLWPTLVGTLSCGHFWDDFSPQVLFMFGCHRDHGFVLPDYDYSHELDSRVHDLRYKIRIHSNRSSPPPVATRVQQPEQLPLCLIFETKLYKTLHSNGIRSVLHPSWAVILAVGVLSSTGSAAPCLELL
jgi:hypothetical protein